MPSLDIHHPLRYWTDFPVSLPEILLKESALDREDSLSDRYAFQIGEDLGIHRLSQGGEWTSDSMERGYMNGLETQARFADVYLRKLLQLRRNAFSRSIPVSSEITVDYLRSITVTVCPISGVELTQGTQTESDWSVDRLANSLGYVPGNVCIIATRVNHLKGSDSFLPLLDEAFNILLSEGESGLASNVGNGLMVIEAIRLGALMAAPSGYAKGKIGDFPPFAMAPSTWCSIKGFITGMHMGSARSVIEGKAHRMRAKFFKSMGKDIWSVSNRFVSMLRQKLQQGVHPCDVFFDVRILNLLNEMSSALLANPPAAPGMSDDECKAYIYSSILAIKNYVR
jgi:hypothetical protein